MTVDEAGAAWACSRLGFFSAFQCQEDGSGCGRSGSGCVHSLSAGHEQDGQAADDRQDHGDDDQDGLGQRGAAALLRFGAHSVDLAALAVVILPAPERREAGQTASDGVRDGTRADTHVHTGSCRPSMYLQLPYTQ